MRDFTLSGEISGEKARNAQKISFIYGKHPGLEDKTLYAT